jgi:hypothetical protein
MNINLHIEHLILDGIDLGPRARRQLRAAVEQELIRLLGVSAPQIRGGAVPSISTPAIELRHNPAELGKQIAGSVYGGIGK